MTARPILRRAVPLLLLTHVLATGSGPVGAAHVATPLVRDILLANLPAGERELSITVDPNDSNRLMAGANQRPGSQAWFASADGGRTWTSGALPNGTLTVPGTSGTTMSDPSLAYGNDGTLYYSALMHGASGEPGTLFVTTTTDQGQNWTDPANGVVAAGSTGPTVLQDKEHLAVDQANNNVYVAWTPIGGPNNWEVVFSRDLNGVGDGFAFSAPQIITTDAVFDGCLNQGTEFAMAGPRLYLAWTSFCSGFGHGDPATVYVTFSDDQGVMWSPPVAVMNIDNVDFIAQGFRSRSHPSIDADPVTGRVYVVAASNADAAGNDDGDVLLVSSPDGVAWGAPMTVNTDPGGGDEDEQWMAWVAVGQSRVSVVYYCWDDEGTVIHTCLSYGDVAAVPAFTEVQLTSAGTPTSTGFLGDYNGNFVGADDVIHPAWSDGRAGTGGSTDGYTARVDFSPPTTVSLAGPANVPWGDNAAFTATVEGAHGEAEQFIPVEISVGGGGTPSSTGASGVTDAAGQFSFDYTNGTAGANTVEVWADLDEDGVQDAGETDAVIINWTAHPTATTYSGPGSGTFSDPVTLSGTLVDTHLGTPIGGETLALDIGGVDACNGVTDAAGSASCDVAPSLPAGMYVATASYAGSPQYDPSMDAAPFEVLKETTVLSYTGPDLIANLLPADLSATLREDDGPPVAGRTVELTIGSGITAQSCSDTTDGAGVATCTIPVVNQPLGPGVAGGSFAGDAFYLASSDEVPTIVFQWTDGGNFVVGDGNAAVGSGVVFWSSQWSLLNSVSGGPAPSAFKGFANDPAGPTGCGGTWATSGGSSPPPPATVPSYTAMLATSSVTKSGNAITGTKPSIVIVQTNSGYGPSSGHTGTGSVVATLC